MNRFASTLFTLFLLLALAGQAQAQVDATIREINAIAQDNIDVLNAAGAALTQQQFQELTRPQRAGEFVRFTAVVLTNPRTSGLGTPDDTGFPDRIHVYVRDAAAITEGYEGMGLQLVDGSYQTTGLINVAVGDVIRVTGSPDTFTGSTGASMQVAPQTIELLGAYDNYEEDGVVKSLPPEILDPVLVAESSDVNKSVTAEGLVQVNWDNLSTLNGQYVRIENATIAIRDISSERPNWLVTTDGGETVINFYDMSLYYRNDRDGSYNPSEFNVQSDDFVPPPPGATVNIQGTLVFQGDDPFSRGAPVGALLSIVPWEPGDLVVTESPPEAAVPSIAAVPAADAPATVTTTAAADPSRTIDNVTLTYFTSVDQTEMTVAMTDNGDGSFSADIPGQAEGTFVNVKATATDNTSASFTSGAREYRVLSDGIDEIADIQEVSGFNDDVTPFVGLTLAMNLTATVQNNPAVNGREIALQDNADLDPWTGITVNPNSALTADLQPGDVINITSALIVEDFGVTQLRDLVYTTVTEGGAILPYKEVTTNVLQDPDVAEAHEGMLLTFDDAVVTSTNPDAPAGPFGEWGISSDGTAANQLRVDDRSNGIDFGDDDDPATVFSAWERLDFIRGVLWFSFGNYKLMPDDLATDVGAVINVATEDQDVPGSFALRQNYPNPFNPSTSIEYTVPATGRVTLEVFDMLGRSVAVLVNGEQAVGTHTARFDAGNLASGLYLYRLTAGSQVQVKKMMLLK